MKDKQRAIISILVLALIIGGAFWGYSYLMKAYKPTNELVPQTTAGTTSDTTATGDEATTSKTESNEAHEGEDKIEAPDFTVFDKDAKETKLSDFKGKPIVVNFWATWCTYCKQEMPDFQKVYDEYGDKVQFMMINVTDGSRETEDEARAFITREGFTFPVFYDLNLEASQGYGVSAMPTTYVIDAEGNILGYAQGMLDEETLVKAIKDLE